MAADVEKIIRVAMMVPMNTPGDPRCRWGAPTILWGSPGIGKSGMMEQAAAICGLPLETVYLSTHQPEDISGIPMPDGKGDVTMVCSLPQVHNLCKAKRGVLFLDELSCARPEVQGAGMGVVYNRVVAGKQLPAGVRVMAGANPPEEAAGGWVLSPPMANRLMHIDVPCPSVDAWTRWLLAGNETRTYDVVHSEKHITERWSDVYSHYMGLGAGFMRANNKLYSLPKAGHPSRGKAWASPRSWEMLLRVLTTCEILDEKVLGLELVGATVGEGVANEWIEWVSKANLPASEDILNNGWKPDKRRLDIAFAAYSAAIAFVLQKTDRAEQRKYALKAWKLLQYPILEAGLADIAATNVQALCMAGYTTKAGPEFEAVAGDILNRLGDTGVAAYIVRK